MCLHPELSLRKVKRTINIRSSLLWVEDDFVTFRCIWNWLQHDIIVEPAVQERMTRCTSISAWLPRINYIPGLVKRHHYVSREAIILAGIVVLCLHLLYILFYWTPSPQIHGTNWNIILVILICLLIICIVHHPCCQSPYRLSWLRLRREALKALLVRRKFRPKKW